MKRFFRLIGVIAAICFAGWNAAQGQGTQVVVIYNTRLAESRDVAEHYAAVRQVPSDQVLGFDLTTAEVVDRGEFRDRLQIPLIKALEERKLLESTSVTNQTTETAQFSNGVQRATIRYAVLCYGIPLRIAEDPDLREADAEKFQASLRRNDAAVDNELACLPLLAGRMLLTGPMPNPLYNGTNAELLSPTNGLLMVTRLDGPTAAIARGLVDKAVKAETEGLWGCAYFDLRGLTNGPYKPGDDEIRGASEICRQLGYEAIVDERPATFPAGFPLSQVALYAGWYDANISGPFARPTVEFMPGAFAYHLFSFSADTLRSTDRRWVGPLLARGVTATMGSVDEPYLELMPNMTVFFNDFINRGWTYGEAAYGCQPYLSWQATVVGDPLYRPGGPAQLQRQEEYLQQHHSPLLEWLYLRIVNGHLMHGATAAEAIAALKGQPMSQESAVLMEKLGDLYAQSGQPEAAVDSWQQALKLKPSPQQGIRISLALGARLMDLGRNKEAYQVYQEFLRKAPDYPDQLYIDRHLRELSGKLGRRADAEKWDREISRLTPPADAVVK